MPPVGIRSSDRRSPLARGLGRGRIAAQDGPAGETALRAGGAIDTHTP
ncbi:MAG: hypothetical protein ACT4PM_14590 [Gemmatimonadales bacterium]